MLVTIPLHRSCVHPYRTPASLPATSSRLTRPEPFRRALQVFIAAISLLRAYVDVAGGQLTTGGVGAVALLCFAFHKGWV